MGLVRRSLVFLCLGLALGASGCGRLPHEPEGDLPKPILLPPPDDLVYPERGLDAVPEKDAILVQWELYPEKEARLEIFRSQERRGVYRSVAVVNGRDTTYLDENVAIGRRYWYFLLARRAGSRSPPSDTFSYKILDKPFALTQRVSCRPVFRWQVKAIPVAYVIKLFELPADKRVWFAVVEPSFESLSEEVRYNFDGTATCDSLQPGHAYRWRVDVIGPEACAGAESNWKSFTCPQ